jgi:hypothetical protein
MNIGMKKKVDIIQIRTAHNRIVNASPPNGGSGCVRLGRSLRSFPRLTPPQFASPANRRLQQERYTKYNFGMPMTSFTSLYRDIGNT